MAVATLAQETCILHPRLDSDLLICAALLHDIGKTREFTLGAEIALSDEGALMGHLALGQQMLLERGAGVPRERLLALVHCVLGHHGPDNLPGRRFRSPGGAGPGAAELARRPGQGRARARPSGVKVRPAQADDFDVVVALLEELGRARVTDETRDAVRALYERHMEDDNAAHLVAEDDGQVIAFCSLHFRERLNHPTPDAWIPDLIVTESARRRGAARATAGGGRADRGRARVLAADARVRLRPPAGPPAVRQRRHDRRRQVLHEGPASQLSS